MRRFTWIMYGLRNYNLLREKVYLILRLCIRKNEIKFG